MTSEPPFEREWQAALERFERQHMGRRPIAQPEGADFLTNDVLGLSTHPEVVSAANQAAREHGVGARASRLLGGDHPVLERAEAVCAAWAGTPAALLFPSGFQANLGVLGSLPQPGDVLLCDALNHASLIDGARLARARVVIYDHGNVDSLERALRANQGVARRWVVTESVFSMDGDLAPLEGIGTLCQQYDARLIVDEAHAVGLLGPNGAGACADLPQLAPVLAARILNGGKALGGAGAFVVGSKALRSWLIHRARSFVYTTGTALPVAAALARSIELLPGLDEARERVRAGARHLAERLDLPEPAGAIVPIPCGAPENALALAEELRSAGLSLHAVRPPTVPEGTSRLRVVVHAQHGRADLDRIADAVRQHRRSRPAMPAEPKSKRATPWVLIGTDTDAGKTVASAVVLHGASLRGPAAYWKPIQSGLPSDTETIRELTRTCQVTLHEPGVFLSLPKSPDQAARAEGRTIVPSRIDLRLEQLRDAQPGPLIVETAGGLCVPWNDHFQTQDWIAQHRPNVILVGRSGLGTLNHTQLTLQALEACGVRPKALLLCGPAHRANRERLAERAQAPTLEIPWFESLNSEALADFARGACFDWLNG